MRHEIASTVGDTAGITQDVGQDPTVGLSDSFSDTSLSGPLPDFCTMCGQEIFCEICGQETENGFYIEADDEESALYGPITRSSTPHHSSTPQQEENKHSSKT
jgi:DNA-directed RNA polymerase II subunit RPB9